MKKYVFLVEDLYGLTGSQRYVNNKCKFLREQGWQVVVFWNYNIAPVVLEHIASFDNEKYIHHELKFYPSWFPKKERNEVLDRLCAIIGSADQIVIESAKLELGAWGELLAQRLRCKHINFVLTEGLTIQNKGTFDYCYAKLQKGEFFLINKAAVTLFFSNFVEIENPEKYYWSAMQGVEVENIPFPAFDNLPQADFTITHFGRNKEYVPNLLSEIKTFASCHPEKIVNFFFLGNSINEDELNNALDLSNIHVVYHPEVKVIPKQIFEKSDVVFATAGCAGLASRYMQTVIAMDVNTYEPLGLLNRTTRDTNMSSGNFVNDKSVSQWLESLLIKGDSYPILEFQSGLHGFDYQMQYINQCDFKYIDSLGVKERMTQHDGIYAFLVKIGLFHLVEYFYYRRRGVKVIWRKQ